MSPVTRVQLQYDAYYILAYSGMHALKKHAAFLPSYSGSTVLDKLYLKMIIGRVTYL